MNAQTEPILAGNPAPVQTDVHELIRRRWSPRAFSTAPVPAEALRSLIEAARWAPSSMNEQPWRLIVADRDRDPESHARVVATLMPFNASWAERAPVLMVVTAQSTFSRNGSVNRWSQYDTGLAIGQLTLQATALGLGVHQMGGFNVAAIHESLGLPDGYEPIAVLAIGYRGNPDDLSGDMRARELATRNRHPVEEWVHSGVWGKPWAQ